MATAIVLLHAYRKASGRASGVARLRESYFTRERGWVWTWGRRDSLADNSPQPPPRTGPSSDDIAASVSAMTVCMKRGSDVSGATSILLRIDICADPWNAAYAHVVRILCVWLAALYRRCAANKTTPSMPQMHHRAS